MKKTAGVLTVVFIVMMSFACKQRQEQKQQPVVYTPAAPPAQMQVQIDQYQAAVKQSPKSAQAWTNLGDVLMDAQRFAEAIDAYEKAIALDPKNVNVLVDQGTCYRGIGKFDKAVELYQKAIKIDPKFPNAHRNLGVVLTIDLHKNAEGVKEFEKYLELQPNAPDAESIRQTIRQLAAGK